MLLKIAFASLANRRLTVLLTMATVAISIAIVLSVEHIRKQAKTSFTNTVSGTDLIVGARSGRINLLLYSVFHIGNATNNIEWSSYQAISSQPGILWSIPISLGDSHKSYRVIGTTTDYFQYYRYGKKQNLAFAEGEAFSGVYDVVLGSEVAKALNYSLGDNIILSHGMADVSFTNHDDKPFQVTGILQPTATPIDQSLIISLAGMEAIHIDWRNGAPAMGLKISAEQALKQDLTPKTITAFFIGLENRILTFRVQREINNYRNEPLLAILPGVALSELWQSMALVEKILAAIAGLVLVTSLLGMITMFLSTLKQRQRELAVMRAVGAHAGFVFLLIELEVFLIAIAGIVTGILLQWLGMLLVQSYVVSQYGLLLDPNPFSEHTLFYSVIIIVVACTMAILPSWLAYRQSVADGLTVRE